MAIVLPHGRPAIDVIDGGYPAPAEPWARLDQPEIQAAVDAADSTARRVLVVPRLDGRYAAVGVVGVLTGRLVLGQPLTGQ